MPITALPTPPSRQDPANFATRADAFLGALPTFATEANSTAADVNASQSIATASAAAASASQTAAAASAAAASASAATAASASGATAWVSGTTYALGAVVYSTVTGRTYRRIVAGAGTTDPSADTTNWRVLVLDMDTSCPTIRPTLNLDFANTEVLDPRITFTRASEARFYDGRTVAKAEENLLLYSQEFDQAAWVKTSGSVTDNSGAAPDGTTTADNFTASGLNGTLLQSFTALAAAYTASIWVRRVTGTGTVQLTVDGTTWSAIVISGTWTRYSTTLTPSAGARTMGIRLVTSGDAVEVWGAQLEQRSAVTAYVPTSNQPITNYIPVLQTAAANVARFDHNPVTGESLGLLIEEQRTNLLLRSEEFNAAAWVSGAQYSVSANVAVAPDGTQTADAIVVASGQSSFLTSVTRQVLAKAASAVQYTRSFYCKALGAATSVRLFDFGTDTTSGAAVLVDLINGSIIASPLVTGSFSGASAVVSNAGNGWWRIALTYTTDTNTSLTVRSFPYVGSSPLTGDGFSGLLVWGAQLEVGAFPTSYIKTEAEQATRSREDALMTGVNFSSWYRQDEGAAYVEAASFARNDIDNSSMTFAAAGYPATDSIVVAISNVASFNRIGGQVIFGGVSQFSGSNTSTNSYFQDGTFYKSAIAYKRNDLAWACSVGPTLATDTSATLPTMAALVIGAYYAPGNRMLNGHIRKIAYYPARLTNAQLQAITTP
jgi:hypothetical protein